MRSALVAVLLAATGPVLADTIVLSNGRTVSGRVAAEKDGSMTIEVADGHGRIVVPRSLVARVGAAAAAAVGTHALAKPSPVRGGEPSPRARGTIRIVPAAPEPDAVPRMEEQGRSAARRLELPKLVIASPDEISVKGRGRERRLRFATTTANRGRGSLEVRASSATGDAQALQQVSRRTPDGELVLDHEVPVGRLFFHPAHSHWHLDGFARYELLDERLEPARGSSPGAKVSFCLRDSKRVGDGPLIPGHLLCSRKSQGISPGWADVYDADTEGQEISLAGVADGVYVLVNELLAPFESAGAATDRVAGTRIRIQGDDVRVLGEVDRAALVNRRAAHAAPPRR